MQNPPSFPVGQDASASPVEILLPRFNIQQKKKASAANAKDTFPGAVNTSNMNVGPPPSFYAAANQGNSDNWNEGNESRANQAAQTSNAKSGHSAFSNGAAGVQSSSSPSNEGASRSNASPSNGTNTKAKKSQSSFKKESVEESNGKSVTINDISEIPSMLHAIAEHLQNDTVQNGKLLIMKEQYLREIADLTAEVSRYHHELRAVEKQLEQVSQKNQHLTSNIEKAQSSTQELRKNMYAEFRNLAAKEEEKLVKENLEIRETVRSLEFAVTRYTERQKNAESILREHEQWLFNKGDGETVAVEATRNLMKKLKFEITPNATSEEQDDNTMKPVPNAEAIGEILNELRRLNDCFSSEKSGSILVKSDSNGKLAKDTRKKISLVKDLGREKGLMKELERFTVNQARMVQRIYEIKKHDGGKRSLDETWEYTLKPYGEGTNERDAVVVDAAYLSILMFHLTNQDMHVLLSIAITCGNRHVSLLLKDTVQTKLVSGLLASDTPNESVQSSIFKVIKNENGCKSVLDILKRLHAVGNFPFDEVDPQTGNTLWHFGVLENNRDVLVFLGTLDNCHTLLGKRNLENLTPIDMCDPSVKEQLLNIVVCNYANEASDCYSRGNFQLASELYDKALPHQLEAFRIASPGLSTKSATENLARLHFNKAKALSHLMDWIEAAKNCEQCMALHPTYLNAYTTAIAMYEYLLDWESALALCQKAYDNCKVSFYDKITELKNQIGATKFQILEIPSSAGNTEIKQAFNRLCILWHPDKASNRNSVNVKKQHENHFNRLREAKNVLSADTSRMIEAMKQETCYVPPKPFSEDSIPRVNPIATPSPTRSAALNKPPPVIDVPQPVSRRNGVAPPYSSSNKSNPPSSNKKRSSAAGKSQFSAGVSGTKGAQSNVTTTPSPPVVNPNGSGTKQPPPSSFAGNGSSAKKETTEKSGPAPSSQRPSDASPNANRSRAAQPGASFDDSYMTGYRTTRHGGKSAEEQGEDPEYARLSIEMLEATKAKAMKALESIRAQKAEKLLELKELEEKASTMSASRYASQSSVLANEIKLLDGRIERHRQTTAAVMTALERKAATIETEKGVKFSAAENKESFSFKEKAKRFSSTIENWNTGMFDDGSNDDEHDEDGEAYRKIYVSGGDETSDAISEEGFQDWKKHPFDSDSVYVTTDEDGGPSEMHWYGDDKGGEGITGKGGDNSRTGSSANSQVPHLTGDSDEMAKTLLPRGYDELLDDYDLDDESYENIRDLYLGSMNNY